MFFPLPHTAAVDAMTMRVGERKIVGVMKRRAEARAVYEAAIQQGQTASLLEQGASEYLYTVGWQY